MTVQQQLDVNAILRLITADPAAYVNVPQSTRDNLAIMMSSDIVRFLQLCALVVVSVEAVVEALGISPAGPARELARRSDMLAVFTPAARFREQLFSCPN